MLLLPNICLHCGIVTHPEQQHLANLCVTDMEKKNSLYRGCKPSSAEDSCISCILSLGGKGRISVSHGKRSKLVPVEYNLECPITA